MASTASDFLSEGSATVVKVVARTNSKGDRRELVDYESLHETATTEFEVPASADVICSSPEVQMLLCTDAALADAGPMLRLEHRDGAHWVAGKPASDCSRENLWVVVGDLGTCGYELAQADIIKLGETKFKVRQMVTSSSSTEQPDLRLKGATCCEIEADHETELSCTTCRICLLEGSSEEDPLIRPCQCRGSIEYVHLGCLSRWVQGRLKQKCAPEGLYMYQPPTCELCTAAYPVYVGRSGAQTPLVELPRTEPPFIVLESKIRSKLEPFVYVISFAQNKLLKLGRGKDCSVRMQHPSATRSHARIRFTGERFFLEDNKSRFGTLVALKRPLALEHGSALSIQAGHTVLSMSLQSSRPSTPEEGRSPAEV
eukprot:gb/GFBE01012578.1/.p1 GENE.gb/GFBE01012578.1/~~gb/GFBE01012578.1/.p1  ORF type:complete len:371 (+),score=55.69 gb/GFBE01012578.1/:1-1113(+)